MKTASQVRISMAVRGDLSVDLSTSGGPAESTGLPGFSRFFYFFLLLILLLFLLVLLVAFDAPFLRL